MEALIFGEWNFVRILLSNNFPITEHLLDYANFRAKLYFSSYFYLYILRE